MSTRWRVPLSTSCAWEGVAAVRMVRRAKTNCTGDLGLPPEISPFLKQAFEPLEDMRMGQKKHKPEEIVARLRQVDVLLSQGRPVAEAIRAIGVTPFTCLRWRKEFGGLK